MSAFADYPVLVSPSSHSTNESYPTKLMIMYSLQASEAFLSLSIPAMNMEEFEFISHAADGGWGSVFKYRRLSDNSIVAMKFFGMSGCAKPVQHVIEEEIVKDWKLNHLNCVAKLLGYIVDSYTGIFLVCF